jgi:hypothetical protein
VLKECGPQGPKWMRSFMHYYIFGREGLCTSDQVLPRAQVLESCGLDLAAVDTFVGTSAGSIQVQ